MHILHVVPTASRNPLLLSMLDCSDASFTVVTLDDGGPLEDELTKIGVRCIGLGSSTSGLSSIHRYSRVVKAIHPDAVECHSFRPAFLGAIGHCSDLDSPPILNVRHHNLNHCLNPSLKGRIADRATSRLSSHNIAVSMAVRDTLIAQGTPANRVSVIRNALKPEFLPEVSTYSPLNDTGRVRLLAVGRLDWQKGYPNVFRALAQLVNDGVDAVIDVLGSGSPRYTVELEQMTQALGVPDRVRFRGFVSDVRSWFSQSDILVHGARDEAFGLVFLEAMSAGLPIVATDAGATREVIGSLWDPVPPDDPKSMADAIKATIQSLAEARARAVAYAPAVSADFPASVMAREHVRLCASLVRRRRGRR